MFNKQLSSFFEILHFSILFFPGFCIFYEPGFVIPPVKVANVFLNLCVWTLDKQLIDFIVNVQKLI